MTNTNVMMGLHRTWQIRSTCSRGTPAHKRPLNLVIIFQQWTRRVDLVEQPRCWTQMSKTPLKALHSRTTSLRYVQPLTAQSFCRQVTLSLHAELGVHTALTGTVPRCTIQRARKGRVLKQRKGALGCFNHRDQEVWASRPLKALLINKCTHAADHNAWRYGAVDWQILPGKGQRKLLRPDVPTCSRQVASPAALFKCQILGRQI
jgi:hypothetical protein